MEAKYNVSVTLTPLEHYFFGDENLNTDGTEKYYQRSLQLPQQTTVLGAMRFLLLQTAGKNIFDGDKIINKVEAKKLIGENSFNMLANQYGKINSISEVLLWHEEKGFYLPLLAWKNEENKIDTVVKKDNNKYFFGDDLEKSTFLLSHYKVKKGVNQYWIGKGGNPFEKNIFEEYQHAGNFKNKENKTDDDDDAYFKMCYYRLDSKFSFVFNMNIPDNELVEKLIGEKRIINVGGERSKFTCEIERIEKSNPKQITEDIYDNAYSSFADPQFTKVILTTDAYTESNPYQNSLLAVTQIKKMRFMQTNIDATNAYSNMVKDDVAVYDNKIIRIGLKQSKLFNLLKRGSVFYFEKNTDVDDFLKHTAFENIGYNKYYKL
ncbi:hypothetical protein AGMMS50239_15990 [Bacteroidia bacterium]|nr:hypothetical protein AGMMS50239_15990 [Bacteroidia bacterium]